MWYENNRVELYSLANIYAVNQFPVQSEFFFSFARLDIVWMNNYVSHNLVFEKIIVYTRLSVKTQLWK